MNNSLSQLIRNCKFIPATRGGGHFRNFWVGMCRWNPGTLDLYQSEVQLNFATLY